MNEFCEKNRVKVLTKEETSKIKGGFDRVPNGHAFKYNPTNTENRYKRWNGDWAIWA